MFEVAILPVYTSDDLVEAFYLFKIAKKNKFPLQRNVKTTFPFLELTFEHILTFFNQIVILLT